MRSRGCRASRRTPRSACAHPVAAGFTKNPPMPVRCLQSSGAGEPEGVCGDSQRGGQDRQKCGKPGDLLLAITSEVQASQPVGSAPPRESASNRNPHRAGQASHSHTRPAPPPRPPPAPPGRRQATAGTASRQRGLPSRPYLQQQDELREPLHGLRHQAVEGDAVRAGPLALLWGHSRG